MTFEWDEEKNKKNRQKHNIDFSEATLVFNDPNMWLFSDPYEGEERWDVVGFIGKFLFVVFTERKDDTIRIISARKANKKERDGYSKNDVRRS